MLTSRRPPWNRRQPVPPDDASTREEMLANLLRARDTSEDADSLSVTEGWRSLTADHPILVQLVSAVDGFRHGDIGELDFLGRCQRLVALADRHYQQLGRLDIPDTEPLLQAAGLVLMYNYGRFSECVKRLAEAAMAGCEADINSCLHEATETVVMVHQYQLALEAMGRS